MRKHILFILSISLLTAFSTTAHAQTRPRQTTTKPAPKPPTPKPDLLVRQDGTQMEVLVTEITDREIIYKRFNNPSGPLFRSQKADFSFLKYGSNDEIEQFTKVVQPAPPQPGPAPIQPAKTPAQPAQTRSTSYAPAPVYQSQSVDMPQGIRFGFKGGIQSTSQGFSGVSGLSAKSIIGFQGGAILDVPLGINTSLRPQLLYSGKGCTLTLNNVAISINYVELPIDLLFKIPTSSGQFLLGGGGYFGSALNGKVGSLDAKIGSGKTDTFTSTDFGLRFASWYDLASGLTLNVFYTLGLSNINPTIGINEPVIKNKTFGVGVGYFLSRK
jgi:hypothetical protein